MSKKILLFILLSLFITIPLVTLAAYPAPITTSPIEDSDFRVNLHPESPGIPRDSAEVFLSQTDINNSQNLPKQNNVNIYFFWSKTCPVCAKEKPFLEKLAKENNAIKIHSFEITSDKEARNLLLQIGKEFNVDVSSVPFTLIGDKYFSGFYSEDTTGKAIKNAIECTLSGECQDALAIKLGSKKQTENTEQDKQTATQHIPDKLKIPLFGDVEIKKLSLPVLTIVIAGLDGFNPCAMWVLLFLISLLLGMQNRKKMWLLGSAFILASGLVYYLFLAAWLNIFLFLGLIVWIRILIGIVAIASAWYSFRNYYKNKNGICEITQNQRQKHIFDKLKNITTQKNFLLALIGIILLAIAVNLVELICSAGLPAIYTQVLSLTKMPPWQYYLYLLAYIIIFMLDDMIVFVAAMITVRATGMTGKYSRVLRLIGGILMFIIGILLIFKPSWLMF